MQNTPQVNIKKVCIVYHHFAHYRLPVLKEFANCREVDFYFRSDKKSNDDIKTIDFEAFNVFKNKHLYVKNIYFRMFLWQKGLIRTLINGDFQSVIFLGEDRFLSTWIAIKLMKFSDKKVFLWTHGLYGRESWFRKKIRVVYY